MVVVVVVAAAVVTSEAHTLSGPPHAHDKLQSGQQYAHVGAYSDLVERQVAAGGGIGSGVVEQQQHQHLERRHDQLEALALVGASVPQHRAAQLHDEVVVALVAVKMVVVVWCWWW